jgi:alanine racemase
LHATAVTTTTARLTNKPVDTETSTARLKVDLDALAHNYHAIARRNASAEVAPVVKADAYGLGLGLVAPHLSQQGAKTFFVARLSEGVALRALLPEAVIYVLDGLRGEQAGVFKAHNLRPILNSLPQIADWQQAGAFAAGLHVDTGMNRLGLSESDILSMGFDHKFTLVMSHLACSDTPDHPMNAQQLTRLSALRNRFPDTAFSLSASGGCFLGKDYAFDMVRPGISLFGGGPFGVTHPEIKPVAHLTARVLQVRTLKPGQSVGYGAMFTAGHDMQIATIGLGYADGLLRQFAASGTAVIQGEKRRLLGRISMDVFSLDVSGLEVSAGDEVEILGADQQVDEVAGAAGTIAYEVLTRLSARIARDK